ncbi:MAG: Phosphonates-binding protein [Anaerolineaceae bacterium]|nr:MAG: Phosphonates-binding protein [Anaerolineaceae bacterium]
MKKLFVFVSMLAALTMLLAACGPEATPTPVAATEPPTAVPTEPPAPALGTPENPIILALAPSANTQELIAGGEAIAAKLTELTGYSFVVTVPTSYAALIEAMGSGNAHVGFLPTVPYIVAYEKGYATIGLVTLRNGADHYAFEVIANQALVDKGVFTVYYDTATGVNTADAATALAQLNGKKPCYADPLSSSGYLVPSGYFKSNGISPKAGAWVQGHPTIVKSIYLSPGNNAKNEGEICDFGTVYVDARTSVTTDFPDVNDKVAVLWVSDPIIPNDTISLIAGMDPAIRAAIVTAFETIASTEDGLALLKNGGYSIGGLKIVDDSFFDDYRVYLESIGFDINSYK